MTKTLNEIASEYAQRNFPINEDGEGKAVKHDIAFHGFCEGWNAALELNPWHSVKERMPEIVHRKAGKECSDPCLCINEDGEYLPLVYNESYDDDGPVYFWTKVKVTEIYDTDIEPDITHWMPILELPKKY